MLHIIIHPRKSKLIILPIKDNAKEPSFHGTLILKQTPKGARAGKFRIRQGYKEDFRAPEELIYLQGITVEYGGKTYYPAKIMNIQNEKRNKRTDYSR